MKGQLCLGRERMSSRIFRKAPVLQVMKRRIEPSVMIKKMNDWTLWRGWPPAKCKMKSLTTSAMDVGALSALRTFALTD
jgi:hypothetical protein